MLSMWRKLDKDTPQVISISKGRELFQQLEQVRREELHRFKFITIDCKKRSPVESSHYFLKVTRFA